MAKKKLLLLLLLNITIHFLLNLIEHKKWKCAHVQVQTAAMTMFERQKRERERTRVREIQVLHNYYIAGVLI